jgi:hypothetical protein
LIRTNDEPDPRPADDTPGNTMNKHDVEAIVAPFYRQALTVNTATTSTAVLEKIRTLGASTSVRISI